MAYNKGNHVVRHSFLIKAKLWVLCKRKKLVTFGENMKFQNTWNFHYFRDFLHRIHTDYFSLENYL